MSTARRLERLADQLQPEGRITFHRCEGHEDLPWEQHLELHRERGERLFTMDLGNADVGDGADAA